MSQQRSVVPKKPQVPVPALAEAFSGLFGGLFSSTCTYPLDVIKTRMQVPGSTMTGTIDGLQTLYREGGVSALYVGLDSEYAKTALQNFSYFYWYSFLKTYYLRLYNSWRRRQHNARFHSHSHSHAPAQSSPPPHAPRADEEIIEDDACSVDELIPENPTPPGLPRPRTAQRMGISPSSPSHSPTPQFVHQHHYKDVASISLLPNLLIGCLAGALAQLLVNPVTVVQTRMMTAKKKGAAGGSAAPAEGLVGTFNSIVKNEGFFTLYDGFIPSMILTTNPSIQFLVFDKLKAAWLRHLSTRNPPRYECNAAEIFVIGAIAKIVATLSTYPYIMAKTRLQMKIDGQAKYTGTMDVIKRQLLEQGIFGLYVGLSTQILKSVAGSATLFMAKEKILSFTLKLFDAFKIGGYSAS